MDEKEKKEKKRIKPRWDVNPLLFLLWLFQRTEKDVVEEILRNRRNITAFSEQVAMENVRRTLQTMNEECFKVVPKMFERQFTHGLMEMTAEQEMMAETLTDTLLSNIVASTTTAQTTAQALYRIARLDDDVFTKAIESSAEYFQLVGNWEVYNADMMETYLRNHGVTAFIDRSGRKWSLRAYCDMATRTANAQARNAEVLTKDAEHDLYRITVVGTTCDICAPLEGRVYSKSGTSPFYPPLASAFGKIDPNGPNDLSNTWLGIHPNCRHYLVPYNEEGKTQKEIDEMRKFSSFEENPITNDPRSKEQIEAYRAEQRKRAKITRELRKKAEKG